MLEFIVKGCALAVAILAILSALAIGLWVLLLGVLCVGYIIVSLVETFDHLRGYFDYEVYLYDREYGSYTYLSTDDSYSFYFLMRLCILWTRTGSFFRIRMIKKKRVSITNEENA